MNDNTSIPQVPSNATSQTKPKSSFSVGCGVLLVLIFVGSYIYSELNPEAFAPAPDLKAAYSQGYVFGQMEASVSLRKGIISKYPFDRGSVRPLADRKSRQLTNKLTNENARQKWVEGFIAGYADKYDNYWNTGNL